MFCLALKGALLEVQGALPEGALVMAYLDDIYIVCEPADTALIFHMVQEVLAHVCHVDVNLGKLVAWSKQATDAPDGLNNICATAWKSNAAGQRNQSAWQPNRK